MSKTLRSAFSSEGPVSRIASLFLVALSLLLAPGATAMEAPAGTIILSITGAIEQGNARTPEGGIKADFDLELLMSLPQKTTVTDTPWTEKAHSYQGPLLRDVLAAVKCTGRLLKVVALNDYAAEVPVSDAEEHDVILALMRDGEPIPIREKGPLFLVYPFDDDTSLQNQVIYNRSVWQIKAIEAE